MKKSITEGLRQWFLEELGKLGQSVQHRVKRISTMKRLMRASDIKVYLSSQKKLFNGCIEKISFFSLITS